DLGESRRATCDPTAIAGEARRPLGDDPHADRVGVAPGEQARAGRRAHRRHMEVVVAKAARGEPVHGGGRDLRSGAAEDGEADVVENDEQDVRRARRGPWRLRPPGRRLAPRSADKPSEVEIAAHRAPLRARCAQEYATWRSEGGARIAWRGPSPDLRGDWR